jgi:hypothetical protein
MLEVPEIRTLMSAMPSLHSQYQLMIYLSI